MRDAPYKAAGKRNIDSKLDGVRGAAFTRRTAVLERDLPIAHVAAREYRVVRSAASGLRTLARGPALTYANGGVVRPVRADLDRIDTKGESNAQVRPESAKQGEEGDARAQARHAQKRSLAKESDEPQAGDRHRAFGGEKVGRESSAEAFFVQRLQLAKRVEERCTQDRRPLVEERCAQDYGPLIEECCAQDYGPLIENGVAQDRRPLVNEARVGQACDGPAQCIAQLVRVHVAQVLAQDVTQALARAAIH